MENYLNNIERTMEFMSKFNVGSKSEDNFFKKSAKYLGELFEAKIVRISSFSFDNQDIVKTVSYYSKEPIIIEPQYKLDFSISNQVLDHEFKIYYKDVQLIFPKDEFLSKWNVKNYIGFPLWDSIGKPLGVIAIYDYKSIENNQSIRIVLQMLAVKLSHLLETKLHSEVLILTKKKVEHHENKYKSLFNATRDAIIIINKTSKQIVDINPTAIKQLGYDSSDELKGEHIKTLYTKDQLSTAQDNIKNLTKTGFSQWKTKQKRKDGKFIDVEIISRLVMYDDEEVFYSTVIDITELKKLEIERERAKKKIKESEVKYEKLSDLTAEGVIIHNRGIIVNINLSIERIFGYSRREMLDKNLIELLVPKKFHHIIYKRFIKKDTSPIELEGLRSNGSIFPIEIEERELNTGELRVALIRDITTRKKTEKELKDAYDAIIEEKRALSNILRTVNDGFCSINKKGDIIKMNPKMREIFGVVENESFDRTIFDFVDEKNAQIFAAQLKKRALGVTSAYEIELLQKGGKRIICLLKPSIIYNNENVRIGSFALVTDITANKKSFKELEIKNDSLISLGNQLSEKNRLLIESKDKYREIFKQSPISILEWDFSKVREVLKKKIAESHDLKKYLDENLGFVNDCLSNIKILSINKAALELFSVTTKEELLAYIIKSRNKLNTQTFKEELVTIASNLTEFSTEVEYTRNDGTIIVCLSKSVVINEKRTIVSLVDISSLKRTRLRLKEREVLLLRSQEIADLGSFEVDLTTGLWNGTPVMERILGIDEAHPRDYLGWLRTIHYCDRTMMADYLRNAVLQQKKKFNREFRLKRNGGVEEFWVHCMGELIFNEKGEPIKMEGTIQNISKYRSTQLELLRSKEKAENANYLKTEFLNNMSHEIRTPMNGILGFTELLEDPNLTSDKRTQFLNVIKNSGQQLLHIIDDLLEISKLETKQVKVQENEVCLNDLFFNLFSIYDIKSNSRKIPLYLNRGLSDRESTIFTDRIKLNRILDNLLDNALKFTYEGFVEFGYSIKTLNDNRTIEIYVKDTGIGIKQNKIDMIFERFSQVENKISKKTGGLGLGLSIAKENAKLLGGEIKVVSELSNGATFLLLIPYKPVYISTNFSDSGDIKEEPKYSILIAEDEEVNFLFLEIILLEKMKLNCNIIHAKNGLEAVELCRENSNIKLVLMDIKMPVMNGYEATRKIKEYRPDLIVVTQSAYSTREDKEMANASGSSDFISKPITQNSLSHIIHKYLLEPLSIDVYKESHSI